MPKRFPLSIWLRLLPFSFLTECYLPFMAAIGKRAKPNRTGCTYITRSWKGPKQKKNNPLFPFDSLCKIPDVIPEE